MDSSNTTVVSFDPYPPPPTLSIYPNATTKRAKVTLVPLGSVERPAPKPLAAAPAAIASPPPSPPLAPPSPPAADPYKPSKNALSLGWCCPCKLCDTHHCKAVLNPPLLPLPSPATSLLRIQ